MLLIGGKLPTSNNVNNKTDLSNWTKAYKRLFTVRWRSPAITQYINRNFDRNYFRGDFFLRLLCICSGRFAFFSLGFCAHEILRRCGQLHNLTPCYNKCMLLNVPSAFFFLQRRCIEPPKVKNILFGITLALDSNSFPRHRLQFECCISLHTSFRRTFFEFPSFTWKTDLSTWMNGVWSTNLAVFTRKKVFWLYCIDSHCIDDGNCVRWWYDRSVINITLHSHYR